MTRPKANGWDPNKYLPLAPNLNILFKATNQIGEEIVLHRFTTGDAKTSYDGAKLDTPDDRAKVFNTYLMQWQQFHYKFVVSEEKIAGCSDFRLEVQNNEPHTDGADYAIDDIRIFKRKPEVGIVQAGDLCDTELKRSGL